MGDETRIAARKLVNFCCRLLAGSYQDGVWRTLHAAHRYLKASESFLAKARMRGDGPPFIKVGRSIRYSEAALQQWMKSRQRLSTSEQ